MDINHLQQSLLPSARPASEAPRQVTDIATITTTAITPSLGGEAPARPGLAGERLLAPGNPQAETNRSSRAPGRLPVATMPPAVPSASAETNLDAEDLSEIEMDQDMLLIRRYLKSLGIEDNSTHLKASDLEASMEREQVNMTSMRLESDGGSVEFGAVRFEAETMDISITDGDSGINISMTRLSFESVSLRGELAGEPATRRADPLTLDLDGDGIETRGVDNGVAFDIDADGNVDQSSFVGGGDAFLALDRNGNGRIDDGSELFGDQNGDANGFIALARYDDNGDGLIDRNDKVFSELSLLSLDALGHQQSQGLSDAGIASISLAYKNTQQALNQYDVLSQVGGFQREDGSSGEIADTLLGYRAYA